ARATPRWHAHRDEVTGQVNQEPYAAGDAGAVARVAAQVIHERGDLIAVRTAQRRGVQPRNRPCRAARLRCGPSCAPTASGRGVSRTWRRRATDTTVASRSISVLSADRPRAVRR